MPELDGKIAIVTGASRGLGRAMALDLAKRGASVLLSYTSDSSTPKVNDLIAEITSLPGPSSARGVQCDLSAPSAPQTILSAVDSWLGTETKINILVNNAGADVVKPLTEIDAADYHKVFDVNVLAPVLLIKTISPRLAERARIINIGSVGARAGFPRLSLYCASKAALEGLTRCWAAELGGNGTTVNQVNPGPVPSEMLDTIPPEIVEMQKKTTPLENRLGTVEEIASVVSWLASPGSGWITGQVVSASGGNAMY